MRLPIYFPVLFLLFLANCDNEPKGTVSAPKAPAAEASSSDLLFKPSTVRGAEGTHTSNWCRRDFSSPVIVTADKSNMNIRRFYAENTTTVYKLAIGIDGITSSFFLKVPPTGTVEYFTSDNFPECLSNVANFTRSADGNTMFYDNKMKVDYQFTIKKEGQFRYVEFLFPEKSEYEMTVRKCASCN